MSTAPRRPPPKPPRPDLDRRPRGAFGWLEAGLLHDRWLAEIGPHATAILVLLAVAADRHGASFYGRDRMAIALGMDRHDVDEALTRLVDAGLVAFRPWRPGGADGVWQLMPVPPRTQDRRSDAGRELSVAEVLRSLGFRATRDQTAD
ncbi:MAG: hypothetical protein MUF56_06500 [Solirubrobacteraceae bacterium]|nr:hypothetical protein [Solirubrobacteraceae bacterium]